MKILKHTYFHDYHKIQPKSSNKPVNNLVMQLKNVCINKKTIK